MTRTMRAAQLRGKEDVAVVDVPRPRPGPGEVVLRIEAALTCGTDAKVWRRGYHARMIQPPALFGHEYTGLVEEVGEGVAGLAPGDAVVGANSAPCDACEYCERGRHALCDDLLFLNGAYAEFLLVPARIVRRNLWPRPEGLEPLVAAAAEPLACVLKGVAALAPRAGDTVLLIGTGSIALMFAAELQALDVTPVVFARSAQAADLCRAMGVEQVVVANSVTDARPLLTALSPDGRGFHGVVEAAGAQETSQIASHLARKGGRVLLFGGCASGLRIEVDPARLHYEEIDVVSSFHHTPEFFRAALDGLASGRIDVRPLLDAPVGLDGVHDALASMSSRAIRGKVPVLPGARVARDG